MRIPNPRLAAAFVGLALLALVPPAHAARLDRQPLADVRRAAAEFVRAQPTATEARVEVEVGRLDPRLRLARCRRPLEAFLPAAGRRTGNLTVGVRCPGDQPWTVYVSAVVRVYRHVAVTTRTLPRGTRVASDDMTLEVRDVGPLRGLYAVDVRRLEGLETRRLLPAGMVLNESVLRAPKVVRRGQRVTVLARVGGLEVRSAGEALADGAAGQVVRVRNLRTRRVIDGKVVASGLVEVGM